MASNPQVKKDYDRTAPFYERRYREIQWEKYRIMVDRHVEGRILDLGCGTGLLAAFLKREVFGVDISFEMLKYTTSETVSVQADAEFLPFKNEVFDAVFSFTCFQNVPSLDDVVEEVRRVLRGGSPFVFTILRKSFTPSVVEKVKERFEIGEERDCGEDVGFICW